MLRAHWVAIFVVHIRMTRLVRAVKPQIYNVIPSGGEAEVECISSGGAQPSIL